MPKYAIYGIWLKLCRLIQVLIYSVSMSKTNTNMNIFGLIKKGEYEYEYIRGDKKRRIRIRIWIFGLIFANTNTNTNIRQTLVVSKYYVGRIGCDLGWNKDLYAVNKHSRMMQRNISIIRFCVETILSISLQRQTAL